MIKCTYYFYSRHGCGIDLGESYVLTGGKMWTRGSWRTQSKVSSYSPTGWTHDLPDLNIPRDHHACSFYTTDSGDNVGFTSMFLHRYICGPQVLMVTGGYSFYRLSSTEIYRNNVWSILPSARIWLGSSHSHSHLNHYVHIFTLTIVN